MASFLSDLFLGKVYSPGQETLADGGAQCLAQMPVSYRLVVYLVISLIHIIIFKYFTGPYMSSLKVGTKSSSLIEKILGCVQIAVFFGQIMYKALTRRLIFALSHCHLCALMQGYLLISKPSHFNAQVYASAMVWSSGAFSALVFPEPGLITFPGELELFWVQHIMTGLVAPLVLAFTGRHKENGKSDLVIALFGFHSFSLFGRLVQGPVSVLTWANINFQLCFPDDQFPFDLFGTRYLYMVEVMFIVYSILFVKVVEVTGGIARWIFSGKAKKE